MARAPRVFISHSSTQEDAARELKSTLKERGIDAWVSFEDIDPAGSFDIEIPAAIERSDAIVLLFCAEADRSEHVRREINLAANSAKPMIPLRLEKVDPDKLKYWLLNSQWIEWMAQIDQALERLVEAIHRIAAQPSEKAEQVATRDPASPKSPAVQVPQEPPSPVSISDLASLIGIALIGIVVIGIVIANSGDASDVSDNGVYDFNADAVAADATDESDDLIDLSDNTGTPLFFGASVVRMDVQTAVRLDLDYAIGGLMITEVEPGSRAAAKDLRPGDILLTANGMSLPAPFRVDEAVRLSRWRDPDTVALQVCRLRDGICVREMVEIELDTSQR